MRGWKIGNVKVEEIPDDDPDVYRRRAYHALRDGQYDMAIQETEMALKYSNNDMKDHIDMVNILCKMQEYGQCLEYIRQHRIVDYYFTEDTGQSFYPSFFESYLECWKHVGGDFDETDVIIVMSDGTGMVKTLQDAIDMECKCHRIYNSREKSDREEIAIIEGKDLCIINRNFNCENLRIIINSGKVHFINSHFYVSGDYSVGVEVNGGNVLFENTEVRASGYSTDNYYSKIWIYVKNQATINLKNCRCSEFARLIFLYAECGKIYIENCSFQVIAVMGKKGKCSLNLLSCFSWQGGEVLVGYNTESQIKDCKCAFITLEGKMQMDGQDNLVMNVFDTEVIFCVAAYNGGIIYLYNSGSADCDLEADNGKIFCENFKSEGETVKLRQGMGKNTEIICDCGYKVVNNLRNEVRMGAFSNKIGWLIRNE